MALHYVTGRRSGTISSRVASPSEFPETKPEEHLLFSTVGCTFIFVGCIDIVLGCAISLCIWSDAPCFWFSGALI
jgi:hypothetical protein